MRIAVSSVIAERFGARIRDAAPAAQLVTPSADAWPEEAQHAEVAYFSEDFWTNETSRRLTVPLFALPGVRWFHTFSAGVDHPAFRGLLERGLLLTNSAGATARPIAQYVLGMMLRVEKRMDAWASAQRERRWENLATGELTGKTCGIVGVGNIGGEVARLAQACGMRVVGCRRRGGRRRYVDALVPPQRLDELLREAHFVVLTVPLSSATEGMIGERELRVMREDAWLINIARGRVVDEAALVRALRERWIAGACLDVFEEEPLPAASELWALDNAIVTPHNSGRSPLNMERCTDIFIENVARYAAGHPLKNRVRTSDI